MKIEREEGEKKKQCVTIPLPPLNNNTGQIGANWLPKKNTHAITGKVT